MYWIHASKIFENGIKKPHHFSEPCEDLKSCSVSWSPHYLPLNWYQIKPYCLGGKNKRRLKSDPCMWNKEGSCKVWPGFKCNMLLAIIWDMTSCPKGNGQVYKPESFITKPLTFISCCCRYCHCSVVVVSCIICHYCGDIMSILPYQFSYQSQYVHGTSLKLYMHLFYRKEMEKRDSALLLSGMTLMLPSSGDTNSCTM